MNNPQHELRCVRGEFGKAVGARALLTKLAGFRRALPTFLAGNCGLYASLSTASQLDIATRASVYPAEFTDRDVAPRSTASGEQPLAPSTSGGPDVLDDRLDEPAVEEYLGLLERVRDDLLWAIWFGDAALGRARIIVSSDRSESEMELLETPRRSAMAAFS